jgi:hypothetical protein
MQSGAPWVDIRGSYEEREATAKEAVAALLKQ